LPFREPLGEAALRAELTGPGTFWQDIRVVAETGSSNTELVTAAQNAAPEGSVLVAEAQTAGRGRLGRSWVSPPGAALTFSVLLRPHTVPVAGRGWVPLLAGVALACALRDRAVPAALKWPNDVLIGDAKVAGILAEQAAGAIVVGIGINVSTQRDELPVPTATSLALAAAASTGSAAAAPDRHDLLVSVLGWLEHWYRRWAAPDTAGVRPGDAQACGLRPEYLRLSATVGRPVEVSLPGGQVLAGLAQDVDEAGRLVVLGPSGPVTVSAGDVVHARRVITGTTVPETCHDVTYDR
jgi:BirA family biotin operon repressor/biotin-[acetyl-CoA-carboxylase] ligase